MPYSRRAISHLTESKKNVYERMVNASAVPVEVLWELPPTIECSVSGAGFFDNRHLYLAEDGSFRAALNNWESELVAEEMKNGAVCWLRNMERKKWALTVPYEVNGAAVPMYPDLVVVRADAGGYVFDILEPHDPSRKDNCPKAAGLAKFADRHWDKYGRIQLIRRQKGPDGKEHFYRLDMSNPDVRQKVRGITTNEELDRIFAEDAARDY